MSRVMLSTEDNPWSPFTHFDEWLAYDNRKGYNTLGRLAEYSFDSPALSEIVREEEHERAMQEVILNEFAVDNDKVVYFILVPNPALNTKLNQ